jgi:phytoene dehydrogenase-like protein
LFVVFGPFVVLGPWSSVVTTISRRLFLSAALVGLSCKSRRAPAGGFVDDGGARGHRLRTPLTAGPRARRARIPIVIVGGGIAGLSAGWQLLRRGFTDFVLLEMEPRAGGNSRWGEHEISPFPWAAHYVPVPPPGAAGLRTFFADLGVFDGAEWSDRALCFAPQERLFIHGRWQEGLEPLVGPTQRERDQFARFDDRIRAFRETGAFTIPSSRGRDEGQPLEIASLDTMSMAAWLDREGFDSPYLRWWIEYGTRDDYGARLTNVSAWAGIHYYAGRPAEEQGPLTWPEGNGWIVRRLLERLGGRVESSTMVERIERNGRRWEVTADSGVWSAEQIIYAAPAFLLPRLTGAPYPELDFEYSPWVTANLVLERWPRSAAGAPPAWDNVLFGSPALGYVVATHQSLATHQPRTIWTYYWALADGAPSANRAWLLAQSWDTLAARMLADLRRAHPDIDDCVSRLDIMRIGHGMIRPTPGFLTSRARQRMNDGTNEMLCAHSDVSGLSLFEEAHAGGVRAADAALARLGRT